MTLREIDDALAGWKSRLGAATQNLTDLQAEPAYRRLTGAGGISRAVIAGITAAKVEPALEAVRIAFQQLDLLTATIDSARFLRANMPLFGADQRLHEIKELLCGNSVRLPAVDVPLEQRSLLDGARSEVCLAPAALLDSMCKTFAGAKDTILEVDKAWQQLDPLLAATSARIDALRERGAPSTELDSAARMLDQVRKRVEADPLGASADLDAQIQPVLARVEAGLAAAEQRRRDLESGMAAARTRFDVLVRSHADAVDACEQARLRIAAANSAPSANEKIEGLGDWLRRLEQKYAAGVIDPVTVGLRNWNESAKACESADGAALAASRAGLELRGELRGRLDALKAKARAHSVAEDDALVELAREAHGLLYTRPTDLDRAGAAVVAYEKALNGGRRPAAASGEAIRK